MSGNVQYTADSMLEKSRQQHRACVAAVEALRWSKPDVAWFFRDGSATWRAEKDFKGVVIHDGTYSTLSLADFLERVRLLSKMIGSAPLAAHIGDEHGASYSERVTAEALWDSGFAPPIGPLRLEYTLYAVQCPIPPRRVDELVRTPAIEPAERVRTTYLVQRACQEQVESLVDEKL